MIMTISNKAYLYCKESVKKKTTPKYVKLQMKDFMRICEGKDKKYIINQKKVRQVENILKLLRMPKGLKAGESLYQCTVGYQWLFYIAVLCVVYRENEDKRRYECGLLEICRKNFKTYTIATIFSSPLVYENKGNKRFKILRDYIMFKPTQTQYIPLSYSTSRLDGRLPNVFICDECGALDNSYPIQAMRSGQLNILNKLGFVISTKYPTVDNPFEDEVAYSKKVLDGIEHDETRFALLFEPDKTKNWETDDLILQQANPVALEIPEIWEDLVKKRAYAIAVESARENFITKHCNIVYTGADSESFINITDVQSCKVADIDWTDRVVYLGLDLSESNDNTSVSMVAIDEDNNILAESFAFIPEGRILEKQAFEKVDYKSLVRTDKVIACGDKVIDYAVVEDFILNIEERYGVQIQAIGYDRWNALSTAQKLERAGYNMVEVRQHSSVLHPSTKLLKESILGRKFKALYLLQQDVLFGQADFVIQTF